VRIPCEELKRLAGLDQQATISAPDENDPSGA
jgi:hypothetical protein